MCLQTMCSDKLCRISLCTYIHADVCRATRNYVFTGTIFAKYYNCWISFEKGINKLTFRMKHECFSSNFARLSTRKPNYIWHIHTNIWFDLQFVAYLSCIQMYDSFVIKTVLLHGVIHRKQCGVILSCFEFNTYLHWSDTDFSLRFQFLFSKVYGNIHILIL